MVRYLRRGIGESIDHEQEDQDGEEQSPRMLKARGHQHQEYGPAKIGEYRPVLLERFNILEDDATQTERETYQAVCQR